MRISPRTRSKIIQTLAITTLWIVCGFLLALYKCVTYDPASEGFVFIVPKGLSLGAYVLVNMIGPAAGGLIGGTVLVWYQNEKLSRRSYGYYMAVNLIIFFFFIFFINAGISYFFYYREAIGSGPGSWREAWRLLVVDPYAVRNIATWMLITVVTLQGLKVYEKYGPGTFRNMLLGRFHRPREVQRVFMFLDLTDSTAMAERLGHVRFFRLLQDFFADVTNPVLNARGSIYDYVGDEVTVTWTPERAATHRLNCIDCFDGIVREIASRQDLYRLRYGFVPRFKAAVHKGAVVVGEMGVIKKEIVYSGDILNTTARMLDQCNRLNQQLIVSREVLDLAAPSMLERLHLVPLGPMHLKGKSVAVELFGIGMGGSPHGQPAG